MASKENLRQNLLVSLFLATAYGHFSRRDRAAYAVTALYVAAGVMLVVFLLSRWT
jgi:small neutral amino acid transporter SnatA (MarC family)